MVRVSSVPGRVLMILPGSRKVQLAVPVAELEQDKSRTAEHDCQPT